MDKPVMKKRRDVGAEGSRKNRRKGPERKHTDFWDKLREAEARRPRIKIT